MESVNFTRLGNFSKGAIKNIYIYDLWKALMGGFDLIFKDLELTIKV